ncbi:hypothetical protein ACHAXS_007477 [Conticribra weissflogii]
MTSSANEHTADEAGGESIFSSDGLPSIAAPLPPPLRPLPSANGENGYGDAVIEEESVLDPHSAFESFAVGGEGSAGWSALSSPSGYVTSKREDDKAAEDPRRRFFRLRAEIDELEAQLAAEGSSWATEGSDEHFQSMTLELKARLDAMGIGGESASLAAMIRGRQDDLSRVISRDLEKFAVDSKSDSAGSGKVEHQSGKIVYELYKSTELNLNLPPSAASREAVLEERLRKLEGVLGVSGGRSDGGGKSLLERLEDVERLSKEVDAKEVDKIAAKAKVIRSDLEAAARAKAKLASNSSNPTSLSVQDAKTITALHNQLVELEGMSSYLPAITFRLTELSNLHSNAADFGVRLDAAEAAVSRSEALLKNVEVALNKMDAGWKDNMKTVEKNVKKLDEMRAK